VHITAYFPECCVEKYSLAAVSCVFSPCLQKISSNPGSYSGFELLRNNELEEDFDV